MANGWTLHNSIDHFLYQGPNAPKSLTLGAGRIGTSLLLDLRRLGFDDLPQEQLVVMRERVQQQLCERLAAAEPIAVARHKCDALAAIAHDLDALVSEQAKLTATLHEQLADGTDPAKTEASLARAQARQKALEGRAIALDRQLDDGARARGELVGEAVATMISEMLGSLQAERQTAVAEILAASGAALDTIVKTTVAIDRLELATKRLHRAGEPVAERGQRILCEIGLLPEVPQIAALAEEVEA